MRPFQKGTGNPGYPYTELMQRKAEEAIKNVSKAADAKIAAYEEFATAYEMTLKEHDALFQKKVDELQEVIKQIEQEQNEKNDIQYLKEKQENALRNFPILEDNIVEKLKGAEANSTREILERLEAFERKQKKRNLWTKILLWVLLVFNLAIAGVVVVILVSTVGAL